MDQLAAPDGSPEDFDEVAASLRADSRDLSTFLEVLAEKLDGALPGRARIERSRGGLMRRPGPVNRIVLEVGGLRFEVLRQSGSVVASFTRVVRGIALKTEQLPLDGWVGELSRALVAQAEASSQDRIALQRLLG